MARRCASQLTPHRWSPRISSLRRPAISGGGALTSPSPGRTCPRELRSAARMAEASQPPRIIMKNSEGTSP
jgi:hypothetical protein